MESRRSTAAFGLGGAAASAVRDFTAKFDQRFDRFQLPAGRLWEFVVDAFTAPEAQAA